MESTTWLLYLAIKLDDIKGLFSNEGTFIIILLLIIAMFVLTAVIINGKFLASASVTEKATADNILKYKYGVIFVYFVFFISMGSILTINTLLPSTKQALALITVDLTLKNQDKLIKTGQDVLEAVDGKVEKYLRIISHSEIPVNLDKVKDITSNAGEALKKGAKTAKDVLHEANDEVKALIDTAKEIKGVLE